METNNTKPNGQPERDYSYAPVFPEARAAEPIALLPDAADLTARDPAAPTNGASEPLPPPFAQIAPGTPVPTWEWRGDGAAPPPPNWYDAPPPMAEGFPSAHEVGRRTWRDTMVGQWFMRAWPLVLLGLSKLKWLTVLFKFKAFTTFGSMLLSLVIYAQFFGFPFAAGFIALLFIHEMGHALVMRQQGIKMTPVLFIPMMGAVIGMREMPKNAYAEANMALGGPILGSLGAVGSVMLWQVTGSPLFLALAYSGFLLNLFNLIPVSPLDGGRAMAAISPWGWLLGLVLLVVLFLRVHSLILGFILIVGGMEVFNRWRSRDLNRAYYEMTGTQRLTISVTYFGLALFLAFAMYALQTHLHLNRPI